MLAYAEGEGKGYRRQGGVMDRNFDTDSLIQSLDLIEPDGLVLYHGSIKEAHGFYLARPCGCRYCARADAMGVADSRYMLTDPFGERSRLFCARRASITPANPH
ncbi:hypothetical protein ACWGI0_23100 [Streptomyces sp. NPDC054802]